VLKNNNKANKFVLRQNYLNPFNPVTLIEYSIPYSNMVTLKVFYILGKEVRTLVNENQEQGNHRISFNDSNLSSGIYFYKLSAGSYQDVKKMILIK